MPSSSSNTPHPDEVPGATRSASVDRADSPPDRLRIGVLSPHNSKETKAILNAVRSLGHEPVWLRDENVTSWIVGDSVEVSPQVDVLVNRLLVTKSGNQLEDLELVSLYEETAPVLNTRSAVANTVHKYRAAVALVRAGLPVPDAFFGRSPETFEEWASHLPQDVTHKRTIGTNGHEMAVVSADDPVGPRIGGEQSFVQEFLDPGDQRPSDVRVYVVGEEVVGAMRRYAPPGEWRTNVALGGEVQGVTEDLPPEPRRLAVEATRTLGLDIGGVDLMRSAGNWWILEVNATAGFKGLFTATGVSAAPYIAGLAVERGGHTVETAQVTELASVLDDSVPACKPGTEADTEAGVLGYTTEIDVGGEDGVTTVVAKSDTGAKRTSVDTEVAAAVGAGPLVGTTTVRSGSTRATETRGLVEVNLRIGGTWRIVTASVTDRSGMSHPVLLGRDVLEAYTLDISRTVEE